MAEIHTLHTGIIKLNRKVIVGDPCYRADGCETIRNMLPGIYLTSIRVCDGVTSRLAAVHESYADNASLDSENPDRLENSLRGKKLTVSEGFIGVDSGQAGIYDADYFRQNEDDRDYNNRTGWYRRVCDTVEENNEGATLDARCAVSRTGFGDGGYRYTLFREKNSPRRGVAIVIDYNIETEEE